MNQGMNMNLKPAHTFNSDRPIESADEDKLDRTGFAHQLADRVVAWRGQESLVIGLYGDWGSGKSSVKNLIVERLKKLGDGAPVVVEFNPWLVSGEEKITQAFFSEVGSKLEGFEKDPTAKARAVSWRKYARALETASQLAGTFDFVSPALGIVAPGAGAWAARRLKQAKELTEQAAASLETQSASLQDTKRELREHFKGLRKPLLVVMDDIDRLTTEEICLVFRLVKANADFPNTIYLLLFQRETAEKALDEISNKKGREFLQKIVQVGFDLPVPSRNAVHQVLFQDLNQLLSAVVQEGEWEGERWTNLWCGGLSHYFTNIRQTYRFLNSFTFMFSAFKGETTLEVNPIDIIAIECLRVFDPDVYAHIHESKAHLTRHHDRNDHKEVEAFGKRLLEGVRGSVEHVKETLQQLFPELESVWGNFAYGDEWYRTWTRQRRICAPEFFDRYFILRLPPGQTSESTIQTVLAMCEDREALRATFAELERKNLLLATIERLGAEESLDKLKNPLPYLLALADVSDQLPRTRDHMFSEFGSQYVRYAVIRVLKNATDAARKAEIISTLIRDSNCVGLAAEWIGDVTEPKQDSLYPKIEGNALAALKTCWVQKVRAFAQQGRLLGVANVRWVLPHWIEWGNEGETKEWVASLLVDPKQTLRFLKAHVNESTAQTMGSYYVRNKGWLSWKTLEPFQPREQWGQAATTLSAITDLTEEEKRTLKLLQGSLKRWQTGIDDSNPRSFEDRDEDDIQ